MSNETQVRHIVTNRLNQPVELHLHSGLVVLPPRGRATLASVDLASPQLRVLTASQVVWLQEETTSIPRTERMIAGEMIADSD
jgi:hypothetical protein